MHEIHPSLSKNIQEVVEASEALRKNSIQENANILYSRLLGLEKLYHYLVMQTLDVDLVQRGKVVITFDYAVSSLLDHSHNIVMQMKACILREQVVCFQPVPPGHPEYAMRNFKLIDD